MTAALTLQQSAALVGRHCWVERRLFEVLGGWSAQAPTAAATLALDRHSQHAAWRAGQWYDRLPILAGVDRDALVIPDRAWAALDDPALAGGPAPGGTGGVAVAHLAVAYRVLLPRLAVAYARHAGATTPVADGPVIRTLGQVRADIASDWAEGETVLQDLLADPAEVDLAATAVAAAERRFLA